MTTVPRYQPNWRTVSPLSSLYDCLGVDESPAVSRARRRAKISDARFPECTSDADAALFQQPCSAGMFGRPSTVGNHAHFDPQHVRYRASDTSGYCSGCPTMHCSGDLTPPTSHQPCPQTHVTAAGGHYPKTYGHSSSQFSSSDTSTYRLPSNSSQNPASRDTNVAYQRRTQEDCLHKTNAFAASSIVRQEGYDNLCFRSTHQASPISKPCYQHDACSRQTESEEKSALCCTSMQTRPRPPQSINTKITTLDHLNRETTPSENFHYTTGGLSSFLLDD
ncbi:hypothetical protein ElyMa_004979100 [Elysia marginata]|uniref:Uncharacterized protein n=1 Tax=Elysia marginata TaxID=1093978 RepID=A0AAV4J5T2_9GAST|nr:hypothetical protein ElyMa_004979100 [Elysia marginata]